MNPLKSRLALCVIGAIALVLPTVVLSCPSSIRTDKLGDGRMYTCYLNTSDADYCYYDCYPDGGGLSE
jgi:hypothetical protein